MILPCQNRMPDPYKETEYTAQQTFYSFLEFV